MFVIGFVASLVAGALLARSSLFLPGATAGQLRDYYTGSQLAVGVSSLLQLLAAAGLAWFGHGLSAAVGAGRWATSATWLAASAFVLSCALSLSLVAVAGSVGDGTLLVLARLTLAFGGPVHLTGLAGLLWFSSRAALAHGQGPRWVMRFGILISPLLLVSLVSLILPAVTRGEPLWRLLAAVWLIAVSAANLRPPSLGARSRVQETTR
ncbi:hypothetical protein [Streptomyces sp. NPDC086766]|uniref:hypothetical protein n=1 Tax=Streptomyces sp. NPDC086766 TaxID=3365754 RepID=UPI0037F4EF41